MGERAVLRRGEDQVQRHAGRAAGREAQPRHEAAYDGIERVLRIGAAIGVGPHPGLQAAEELRHAGGEMRGKVHHGVLPPAAREQRLEKSFELRLGIGKRQAFAFRAQLPPDTLVHCEECGRILVR